MADGAKKDEILTSGPGEGYSNENGSGWYRIAEVELTYTGNKDYISTLYPTYLRIFIRRAYSTRPGEFHLIDLLNAVNNVTTFKSICDVSGSKYVAGIRYYDIIRNNKLVGCIDIECGAVRDPFSVSIYNNIQNQYYVWHVVKGFPQVAYTEDNIDGFHDGFFAQHTFKSNSWLDGPDSWPLT